MLDNVPHGARAAGFYRLIEQEGIDRATVDPSIRDSALAASLGYKPDWVRLGNWLEVVRVGALGGDRAFLLRGECTDEADAALTLPGLSDGERAALEKVRDMLGKHPDGDLMVVEGAAAHALSLLASS